MFYLNQIDETHLQFSGWWDEIEESEKEEFIESIQDMLIEQSIYGETLGDLECDVVNEENISHKMISIKMDDSGYVYGTLEILNTPQGNTLKEMVDYIGLQYAQGNFKQVNDKCMFNIYVR